MPPAPSATPPGGAAVEDPLIPTKVAVYNRSSFTVQVRLSNSTAPTVLVPGGQIELSGPPTRATLAADRQLGLTFKLSPSKAAVTTAQSFDASIATPRLRRRRRWSRPSTAASVHVAASTAVESEDVEARWSLLALTASSSGGGELRSQSLDEKPTAISAQQAATTLPFLAYRSHPTVATSAVSVLLIPSVDVSSFMSRLPADRLLSALTLPGTHESAAQYGWPISSCQPMLSVGQQLDAGIRFLDVRLSIKGDRLLAYHGVTDQKISFDQILAEVYAFLDRRPREAVLMSIKQENDLPGFKEMVLRGYIEPAKGRWFVDPPGRIPTLGEARGKIVLISRFGSSTEQPGGIHPPIWPNSSPDLFRYTLPSSSSSSSKGGGFQKQQSVETQDYYNIGSLASLSFKFEKILALLSSSGGESETLSLNFCSGSTFPLALPPFVAKGFAEGTKNCWAIEGINSRILAEVCRRWRDGRIAVGGRGREGMGCTFAMDYFDHPSGLVEALVAANF